MKMLKKESSDGVAYARKADYEYEGKQFTADILNGDIVEILNAGSIEEGSFGAQHYFKIRTRNGEKKAPFNQSSINILVDSFGDDSESWIGKEVTVITKKGVFAGKKGIACYFVTPEWQLDDYGDLVNTNEPSQELSEEDKVKIQALRNAQNSEDVDAISPEDIPF